VSIGEAAERARLATDAILADLAVAERGVVVDSPPGAGKSTLVVRAAAELAEAGDRVMVVGQTNEQVDDLVDRLATSHPDVPVGRLSAGGYTPAERFDRHANVAVRSSVADLIDHPLVVGTAAKWATIADPGATWPVAIVDEAYQMRSDSLLRIARLFGKAMFVGDPGQLDPFSTVETERWLGLSWDPMSSAVAVLLANNADVRVHTLPVSWRLPASAAPVVSEAFYPFTGFTSATDESDRRMKWNTVPFGKSALDLSLETAAATGWALHELAPRHTLRTDGEAVRACAELAARLLERGAVTVSEGSPGPRAVTPDRVAIGVAHRDQAAAVRRALADLRVTGIAADTANRLQGREFDVMIMLHPLSGRRDATAFHLEAGRLCVLASRHRHACVVVARAGIPELLDAHPSAEPVHLGVPVKFPDGWEAHQAFLAHLSKFRVPAV
jgi:AAA domain